MNFLRFIGLVCLGLVSFILVPWAETTNGVVAFSTLGVLLIVLAFGFVIDKPPKLVRIILASCLSDRLSRFSESSP